jgi:hypothetical protein
MFILYILNMENIDTNKLTDPEMDLINNYIDHLNYEEAKRLLIEKLKTNPNEIEVIDTLAEVLYNLDEMDEAMQVKIIYS